MPSSKEDQGNQAGSLLGHLFIVLFGLEFQPIARPARSLVPAFEAASKHDTSSVHAIVVPCRLPCSRMVRRLHSGMRFNPRKHEEVHYEKRR